MQCSSCGARFAPELATRYSHHLDWHFRQNRRERDSARKAHSRPWYYDVSDWIQFEEIEDLEDRGLCLLLFPDIYNLIFFFGCSNFVKILQLNYSVIFY